MAGAGDAAQAWRGYLGSGGYLRSGAIVIRTPGWRNRLSAPPIHGRRLTAGVDSPTAEDRGRAHQPLPGRPHVEISTA